MTKALVLALPEFSNKIVAQTRNGMGAVLIQDGHL